MTLPHNAMIALKGGNAILFSPHPKGKNCGKDTVNYMRGALKELGAPVDLVQIVDDPTVEISGLVMKLADACISTGGPGMSRPRIPAANRPLAWARAMCSASSTGTPI